MISAKKVDYLVVDTSAFIKNVPLQEAGNNIITEQSVINEITSKRQLRRLVVLPYELLVKDVFPENIKFVTEFAKKTGDYTSLSATDIKVIALTYQLEKEKVGIEHLKDSPTIVKTVPAKKSEPLAHPKSIAGFFIPKDSEDDDDDDDDSEDKNDVAARKDSSQNSQEILEKIKAATEEDALLTNKSSKEDESSKSDDSDDYLSPNSNPNQLNQTDLAERFKALDCNVDDLKLENEDKNVDDILVPIKFGSETSNNSDMDLGDSDESDDECNYDNNGWITLGNVVQAKKMMDSDILSEKPAKVACMTTDFAMQNVLMQIGLNVAALDGRVIKQMRTFIFRCYACFKTTSIMTKVFCPNCGMKTLKKVAVSLDDKGNEEIHINFRRPLTARGKRFSLPTPQGGKHANNPILCEDQPVPDQRPSRLARTKVNPLDDDYIAQFSPFATRDVYSRSAMLGIRAGHGNFKYWMRKNPNECKKRRK
ncbi:RNA-binding protein NOB1 [Chelonus insularis]|uniref:RNA-binding protein NOB1 n=1 Tax=Chelonus insularis TaxID=460826 RepID=UPI00158A04E1|nr:RNA-binding protein NOB1 [Chelonus insularis]